MFYLTLRGTCIDGGNCNFLYFILTVVKYYLGDAGITSRAMEPEPQRSRKRQGELGPPVQGKTKVLS
jgi:hypothetical protein